MQMRQGTRVWVCKKCNMRGSVKFRFGSTASDILDLIEGDHKETSPGCKLETKTLRIIYPGRLSTKELAEVAKIPTRKKRW